MKTFFQLAFGACLTSTTGLDLRAQIVWTEPAFPTANDQVTLYYDIAEGNGALLSANATFPRRPVRVRPHWGHHKREHVPRGLATCPKPLAGKRQPERGQQRQRVAACGGHGAQFDFGGLTLAEYYGVGAGETIEQLAFVFRNANGSIVGKTADEGDIFYNVSDGSFEVALTSPSGSSVLETLGNTVTLQVQATQPCDLTLEVNGEAVASGMGTSLSHDLVLDNTGDYVVTATGAVDGASSTDHAVVVVLPDASCVCASCRHRGRHQPHGRRHGRPPVDGPLQGLCVCGRGLQRLDAQHRFDDARCGQRRNVLD